MEEFYDASPNGNRTVYSPLPADGNLTIERPLPPDDQEEMDAFLYTFIPPLFIALGTIGNVLTLLGVHGKNLRQYSVSFYLGAYAVANLLLLFIMCGSQWVSTILSKQFIVSDWACRLWQFIIRVITYLGIWIVVAMTIDRYIAVWHSRKASSLCSLFMAKFAIVIILVGLIVVSIHAMWVYELMSNGRCFPLHSHQDLHVTIWLWMSASFYTFIPLTLLCILDFILLIGIILKHHRKPPQPTNDSTPYDLTYTTLALSIAFFLLASPATILNVINFNLPPAWLQDVVFMRQFAQAGTVCEFLTLLNPVILFLICFSFSKSFRAELYRLMKVLKKCSKLRHRSRGYEMPVTSNGGNNPGNNPGDCEVCSETTPL